MACRLDGGCAPVRSRSINPQCLKECRAACRDYGFFADGPRQLPGERVIPYALNTPLWSDGAEKLRFIYLPEGNAGWRGRWGRPAAFSRGRGNHQDLCFRRRPEPPPDRNPPAAAPGGRLGGAALSLNAEADRGDPLRWQAGRLDLVTPAGEANFLCHPQQEPVQDLARQGRPTVIPIGPKARNLSAEWLGQIAAAGRRLDGLPRRRRPAARLVKPHTSGPAEPTGAAYLDVNCAHCHQPGGGASNSGLDLRWEQEDPHAIGVLKRPVAAGRGAGGHDFSVLPGAPDQSILLYRMDSAEPGIAMPELGKASVDHDGVAVIRRWISEMQQ